MVQTISRYETYKPSGIDWIGEVPEHWEIIRVKGNCYVKGRIGWQELRAEEFIDEGIHCVTGTDFNNQFVNWDTCYRVSLERYLVDDNIQLKEGDVLITKDGTIGKTAIVKNLPEKATLNSGIFLVRPEKARLENEYLYWILNSKVFEDYNDYTKTGATILHLYQNVFVEMHFPLPDNDEQLSIANYLDDQTQKIDRLIANKKAQAEKLKELRQIEINNAVTKGLNPNAEMIDSGIEWLGKIPKHWEKRKIATNFQIIGSGTTPDAGNEEYYDELGKYYFVNTGDLKDCEIYDCEKKITEEAFSKFTSLKLFPVNTLLIAMYGATIGKVGILKTEATTNQACCALANSYRFNIDYMFYFFIGIREDIIRLSYGGGQPNISQDTIKQLRIPCPPKDEQLQIVEHLKYRIAAIDQFIKNIESQIEKLQELRKIKIYEAVTGKIKVNAYAETTA